MRDVLTADRIYYFNGQTGSDLTGDGLSASTAWASLQHAWDSLAATLDLADQYNLMLQNSAPSSFVYTNAGLKTSRPIVGQASTSQIKIDGAGAVFDHTNGSYIFMGGDLTTGEAAEGVKFRLQNMKLRAANGGGVCANGSKIIVWQDVDFGPMTSAHMNALNPSGEIIADGSPIASTSPPLKQGYTISGGAAVHAAGLSGGFAILHAMKITITAPAAFLTFLQGAYPGGSAYAEFTQWINPAFVAGKQFDVSMGGFLSSVGSSGVPGTIAGTVADAQSIWQH